MSNGNVRPLRFAVLLPLIHLILVTFLICFQESRDWPYVDSWAGDEEILNPPKGGPGAADWDLVHEYFPPVTVRAVMGAEFPADILVGWYRHPPYRSALLQPLFVTLAQRISVKRRIVALDLMLILTICFQWWAVGRWIDYRGNSRQTRWVVPAAVITLTEAIAAALSHQDRLPDFIAAISALLALAAWLVLLGMFATVGIKAIVRLIRHSSMNA